MRVLIADDSAALRKVQRSILESMGHSPGEIIEAEDGNAVVALYRSPQFDVDLILADGDLRGMDGLSLLRFLKSLTPARTTPVVLCVNSAQRYLVAEATKLGLREHVVRPFTDEEMRQKLARIEAALQVQKSQHASDVLRDLVTAADVEASLPFLLQLPSALMEEILRVGTASTRAAGSVLLEPGDPVDALHLVMSGEIELVGGGGARAATVVGMGEPFGEVQFLAGGTLGVKVRARTDVEILSVGRVEVGGLVDRHPRFGDRLRELAARKSRAAPRGNRSQDSEFSGSFRTMSFSDVVQLMQVAQKNGVLTIETAGRSGGLRIAGGEVKHAWIDGRSGEDAFFELASWKDAAFSFEAGSPAGEESIRQPTLTLLMEAMRRQDEAQRQTVRAAG